MTQIKFSSIFFHIFILYILPGYGKIIAQEVISSSGNFHKSENGSISYTIGEPVIETFSITSSILTQGFQQTNLTLTAINELPGLEYEIAAFPNPSKVIVKLRIVKFNITGMQYQLYDLNGKLLLQNKLESIETDIPFSDLSPAEYILRVTDHSIEVKSFKIVKTRLQ